MPTEPQPPASLDTFGKIWKDVDEFPPIKGYEDRVVKLRAQLNKTDRQSFALIGPSGVGKTAILHSLFREMIAEGWTIIETSTVDIIRGATFVGEWQTRVSDLMESGSVAKRVVIYIKDLHNLRGSGASTKSNSDMADALITPLDRGEVVVIGECTNEAYRKGVETHPGLKRSFTAFQVVEPKKDEVRKLVNNAFELLQQEALKKTGHELELPATTVASLEQLGGIYFSGTAQPGASIDLLRKIVELRSNDLKGVASGGAAISIEQGDIVGALHRISGLPLHLLDDNIPLDLKETRHFFESRVVGQGEALKTVVDLITLIKAGLTDPGKPTGIMMFAGPTGVGKTELAKALAEFLFGSADRMIRCDMSEYKEYNSYEKFVGRSDREADPSSLVSQVRRQPFSIILLDEVEKANSNIFDILLQAFDDGRLTDPNGNTTDLTQTIIIMTSNLGSDLSRPKPVGFDSDAPESCELVWKALQQFFRPEFLNRIDHIIRFQPLKRDHIRTLAKRELGKALLRSGLIRRELRVSVEPEVHDLLALKGYDEKFGARPLRRQVEKLAVLPVAREIIGMNDENRGSLMHLSVAGETISVKLVEDRQTRTAQKMVQGIHVVDPVDGSKSRVTVAQVTEGLNLFGSSLAGLRERYEEERLEERKGELVAKSSKAEFWDDQKKARHVLSEIYRLERLSSAIDRAEQSHDRLTGIHGHLLQQPDEGRLKALALDLRAATHYASLVSFAVECQDSEERRDAYVVIRMVDEVSDHDVVFELAECYRRWAERKEYTFRVIHEEGVKGATALKEIVVELGGPAAFGIFHSEEGEHEFLYEKTRQEPKHNCFVSVRVLGISPDPKPVQADISIKSLNLTSRFGGKIKSSMSIAAPGSARAIRINSSLKGKELEEAGMSLLVAEMEHSIKAGDGARGSIIRKYTMSSRSVIKDQRLPDLRITPRDFWKGEIDELLHAGLAAKSE